MSLVNEMLSDLQSNHPTPVSSRSFVEPVKPNLFNKYVLFIMLLSSFLIVYYFLFDYFKPKLKTTTNTISIKTKESNEDVKQLEINKPLVKTINIQTQSSSKIPPTSKPFKNKEKKIKPTVNHIISLKKPSTVIIKPTIAPTIKTASLERYSENKLVLLLQKWTLNQSNHNQEKIVEFLQKTNQHPKLWHKSLKNVMKKDFNFYKRLLKISLDYHSRNASFLYLSAKNHFSEKEYSQSLDFLKKIDLNDWNKNTYKLAALSSQKLNKHNQAVTLYLKLLENHENTGEINMAIAISYNALNLKKEAVHYYKAAFNKADLNKLQKQFIRQQIIVLQG